MIKDCVDLDSAAEGDFIMDPSFDTVLQKEKEKMSELSRQMDTIRNMVIIVIGIFFYVAQLWLIDSYF